MAAWSVIQHDELATTTSSWSKTGIPTDGTYDHLCLKWSMRTDRSPLKYDEMGLWLNNDTGSNYSYTQLGANSATPASWNGSSAALAGYFRVPASASLADTFGSATIWIPNYANSTNYTQMIVSNIWPNNSTTDGEWYLQTHACMWNDTAAVDEIMVHDANSTYDMVQYSSITLYGIKGA